MTDEKSLSLVSITYIGKEHTMIRGIPGENGKGKVEHGESVDVPEHIAKDLLQRFPGAFILSALYDPENYKIIASDVDSYRQQTIEQLKEFAGEHNVALPRDASKAQIIDLLLQAGERIAKPRKAKAEKAAAPKAKAEKAE